MNKASYPRQSAGQDSQPAHRDRNKVFWECHGGRNHQKAREPVSETRMNANESVTSTITTAGVLQQIGEAVNVLKYLGHENIVIQYGWGCNLDYEDLWKPIPVRIDTLMENITKSKEEGIFMPGSSDLYVSDLVGSFQLKFCHESDIHLSTNDRHLFESITKVWEMHSIGWTTLERRLGVKSEPTIS